jgi:hypothetical protein
MTDTKNLRENLEQAKLAAVNTLNQQQNLNADLNNITNDAALLTDNVENNINITEHVEVITKVGEKNSTAEYIPDNVVTADIQNIEANQKQNAVYGINEGINANQDLQTQIGNNGVVSNAVNNNI